MSGKRQWMAQHVSDPYVKKARKEGFRSRAVYKLMEIDEKDRIVRPGSTVIDLGAAPGGWSQWVSKRLQGKGRVIALDCLPMEPLPDVTFIQGDFLEDQTLEVLLNTLGDEKAGLVISDMAPNMSGVKAVDIPRVLELAELAMDLSVKVLAKRGVLLMKIFQGAGTDVLIKQLRTRFSRVVIRKPKASRPKSRECYVLSQGFLG
jgi:23S rRNA (uridine2552-2'-O)-methyltransferase